MNVIKVDIKDIKSKFPKSEYPMLEYSRFLLTEGHLPDTRLEAWNYERKIPEADWTVENIGEYSKFQSPSDKSKKWRENHTEDYV